MSVFKGGSRFCQPYSICELYRTLAVPTITYGLELTHVTDTQMKDLDIEGRKALKFLFNLSPYSKNYLNSYFHIKPISDTINNNKIHLLAGLMNSQVTSNVVIQTLRTSGLRCNSLIWDCHKLTQDNGINFFDLLLNVKKVVIESTCTPLSDETSNYLKNCFRFWNVAEERRRFKNLLEENIPVKN